MRSLSQVATTQPCDRGYNNRGWNNVIKTWELVVDLIKEINQAGEFKVVNIAYKKAEKLKKKNKSPGE